MWKTVHENSPMTYGHFYLCFTFFDVSAIICLRVQSLGLSICILIELIHWSIDPCITFSTYSKSFQGQIICEAVRLFANVIKLSKINNFEGNFNKICEYVGGGGFTRTGTRQSVFFLVWSLKRNEKLTVLAEFWEKSQPFVSNRWIDCPPQWHGNSYPVTIRREKRLTV